ncbi:uncharacterized protein LOC144101240 [Amblyomma americanum]
MAPGVERSDLDNPTGAAPSTPEPAAGAARENAAEEAERMDFDQRLPQLPAIEIRQEDIDELLSVLLNRLREAEANKDERHRERMATEEKRHRATIAILNQLSAALRQQHPPAHDGA